MIKRRISRILWWSSTVLLFLFNQIILKVWKLYSKTVLLLSITITKCYLPETTGIISKFETICSKDSVLLSKTAISGKEQNLMIHFQSLGIFLLTILDGQQQVIDNILMEGNALHKELLRKIFSSSMENVDQCLPQIKFALKKIGFSRESWWITQSFKT